MPHEKARVWKQYKDTELRSGRVGVWCELIDAKSSRSLFVPSVSLIIVGGCMLMDSRPRAHGSAAIMSLVRGEYKVNMISVSQVLPG